MNNVNVASIFRYISRLLNLRSRNVIKRLLFSLIAIVFSVTGSNVCATTLWTAEFADDDFSNPWFAYLVTSPDSAGGTAATGLYFSDPTAPVIIDPLTLLASDPSDAYVDGSFDFYSTSIVTSSVDITSTPGMLFIIGVEFFYNQPRSAVNGDAECDALNCTFQSGFVGPDGLPDTKLVNLPIQFTEIATAVVPIPGAVWLFGSGLLGLIGVARRKKS